MKKCIIILLFTLHLVACEEDADFEGGKCTTNTNESGVCRYLQDCESAINLLRIKKKIKTCFYNGIKRYVCCVQTPIISIPSRISSHLEPISDLVFVKIHKEGVLKSGNIECRFNDTFPIICRRIVHDFTTLRFNEPPKCPVLEKPYVRANLLPHQSVIYDACYAYSRLGSKCFIDEFYTDEYYRDTCQSYRTTFKISDGDLAKIKEFPHMAVTGCRSNPAVDILWIGGGSLISEYFILTAAHALGNRENGSVNYALLGTLYKNDTRSGELYHIVQRIRHPKHSSWTLQNDIALLKLHTRVRFSEFIRPACLTFPGAKEFEQNFGIVAGWGSTGEKSNTSDKLLKGTIYQEYNHTVCKEKMKRTRFVWDNETMICAKSGVLRPKQDTCKGDSGGPLMTMSSIYVPCSYFVVGIVSWGSWCGVNLHGSYTNVSYDKYQEWIVENVWPLEFNSRKIILL
ncbi:PREDICTED: venom serine protease Bi-VSP-like [Papilio polytes]|uniref:venom serine protease Bi-VSP-like n=1 Tax=Papilio polytes TaxID=76194 RepID=UPI000676A620|nr:PREDICTED: venom serine protease Bi-VSP-like [Papilio polytes]